MIVSVTAGDELELVVGSGGNGGVFGGLVRSAQHGFGDREGLTV